MPLVAVYQRSDGLKVMSMIESYDEFKERMQEEGWLLKKFSCYDPVAVKNALHRWYDPLFHKLSKEHYPGHENEFWYRERI